MAKKKQEEKFIYCSLRHCPNIQCLRHNKNTPYNVLITRDTFKPDKEWNCKDMVI